MPKSVELVQGTLDFLILKTLTWGPMHGFEISHWIRRISDEALEVLEGALYPALHRMERRNWLSSEWAVTEKNRRAKYYQLTAAGRERLVEEDAEWRRYVAVVGKIVAAARA